MQLSTFRSLNWLRNNRQPLRLQRSLKEKKEDAGFEGKEIAFPAQAYSLIYR